MDGEVTLNVQRASATYITDIEYRGQRTILSLFHAFMVGDIFSTHKSSVRYIIKKRVFDGNGFLDYDILKQDGTPFNNEDKLRLKKNVLVYRKGYAYSDRDCD